MRLARRAPRDTGVRQAPRNLTRVPGVARRLAEAFAVVCALAAAGCGRQSTLAPHSPGAHSIATLWWWMLVAAAIVFAGAVGLIGIAWVRRGREGVPVVGRNEGFNLGMVVLFGIGIPIVTLIALFVAANFVVLGQTDVPASTRTPLTIQVIGKQWFWEVRYPGTSAVTANEIHIPVRTRVTVVTQTADVIHSFWVPELMRKVDTIPGRRNRVVLFADRPGRYRGQCAEFCGAQHAHMGMYVFADAPARFRAWLAGQARPRRAPATPAQGQVGPDLTHLGSRTTLAALTIPNTPATLAAWIRDPQRIKPGNRMPSLGLDAADARSLAAYLESLR